MKLVSYNINGIRASSKYGILKWLKQFDADIYCFQELRANESIVDSFLTPPKNVQVNFLNDIENEDNSFIEKYDRIYNCGTRPGYSGTAVLTKIKPIKIVLGIDGQPDPEGRTMTLYFKDFILVNSYVPNGGSRLQFKLDYLEQLINYLKKLLKENNVIFCGDTNISHNEIDLSHPHEYSNVSSFLPIERQTFTRILKTGFIDVFRHLYPTAVQYTWRSYGSRRFNISSSPKFRFDYFLTSKNLIEKIKDCYVLDLEYSDHLPVILELNP